MHGMSDRSLWWARAAALVLSVGFAATASAQQQQQRPQQPQQRPAAPAAPAGPMTAPVVAIVDFPAVVRESNAAKAATTQLEKIRQTYEAEVQKIERAVMDADQELSRQRSTLTPEQFAQKRREFEQKFQDAQRAVQERQRKLEQAYGQAWQQIETRLIKIIEEMIKSRGINMVLGKTAVVIAETRFDMSKEVLDRLNVELPSVTVQVPK